MSQMSTPVLYILIRDALQQVMIGQSSFHYPVPPCLLRLVKLSSTQGTDDRRDGIAIWEKDPQRYVQGNVLWLTEWPPLPYG